MREAERACRRNLARIALGRHFHVERLLADERMIVENVAGEQEAVGRNNGDTLRSGLHGHRTSNAQEALAAAVGLQTRGIQQFHIRRPAAVQDGNFQVVDLDVSIVHAHAVKHAEQVLGGGDEHALPHQASGVADAGHVAPKGRNGEIIEIGSEEDNARGRRRGKNSNRDGDAAVKSDPLGLYWPLNSCLKPQCGFLWVVRLFRFARYQSKWMFHFTRD